MNEARRPMRIRLDAGEVEAAWWGPGPDRAPTLVLLHEGLGCLALWRDLPEWLAADTGCGVFAWSRLGYGHSDPNPPPWPLDYMRREATEALPRVLDAAGVRRGVLVGHSDGASIAALHSANVADPRIAGLVLIAPHVFTEPSGLEAIAAAREAYLGAEFRSRLARYHDHVNDAFWGWNGAWLDPDFATGFDLTGDLPGLRLPVLVVQGEDDPYGTPAQPEAIARLAAGTVEVMMVPGARHAPHLEAPETVRPAIAAFVGRVLRA